MLNSLRLRSLRSFPGDADKDYIELKPLTILIGKNSSGKSTFIRSLPLLRQSIEKSTNGPILWYGDYVDFGAFSEARYRADKEGLIYFDFKMSINLSSSKVDNGYFYSIFGGRHSSFSGLADINVEIQLGVAEEDGETIAKEVVILIEGHRFDVIFHKEGVLLKASISFDKEEQIFESDVVSLLVEGLIPRLGMLSKKSKLSGELESFWDENALEVKYKKDLYLFLVKYFAPQASKSNILRACERLPYVAKEEIYSLLNRRFRDHKAFIKNLNSHKTHICDRVYSILLKSNLSHIVSAINSELGVDLRNVRYIAPIRATAERYYRHQDLKVDEIDHLGTNLAMMLKSLSEYERESLSNWMQSNFGFTVRVAANGLHYELRISDKNESDTTEEFNINDMGFGFSQILPIIVSIWLETVKSSYSKKQIIFLIEQPELHLHPEYQARLSKMFASVVKSAKSSKINVNIVFETHSQTMIDSIGDCIEEGYTDKDDVSIVLFEKDSLTGCTSTRFSSFDKDGMLVDWPVGFFAGRS